MELLNCLLDPISYELMIDPVFTEDNITYDRNSIVTWFKSCDKMGKCITSPVTNKPLCSRKLRPNLALHGVIEVTVESLIKMREKNQSCQLGRINDLLGQYLEEKEARKTSTETYVEETASNNESFEAVHPAGELSLLHCPTCLLGHRMELVRQRLPTGYSSVCCDSCGLRGLERSRSPFFNCLTCQYDLCDTCAILMHMQDEMSLFERLMIPLPDRRTNTNHDNNNGTNSFHDLLFQAATHDQPPAAAEVPDARGTMSYMFNRFRRAFSRR
jgi:hypothetical protein